jgi:hypothetical protein
MHAAEAQHRKNSCNEREHRQIRHNKKAGQSTNGKEWDPGDYGVQPKLASPGDRKVELRVELIQKRAPAGSADRAKSLSSMRRLYSPAGKVI